MKFRTMMTEKLLRRLELPDLRPDMEGLCDSGSSLADMSSICHAQKRLNTKEGMMFDELAETGGLLIAAGAETTASLLSGVTYHLLMNPSVSPSSLAKSGMPSRQSPR